MDSLRLVRRDSNSADIIEEQKITKSREREKSIRSRQYY